MNRRYDQLAGLADQIARVESARADEEALREVRKAAATNPAVLSVLLKDRRVGVREWVLNALPMIADAPIEDLADQVLSASRGDSDIWQTALDLLVARNPDRARRWLPAIRRQLKSSDFFEPEDAMWTLLALRDLDSTPEIGRIANERRDGIGTIAEIVLRGMDNREEELSSQLLRHEAHHLTKWLARAAAILGSPSMIQALVAGSHALPDEPCRQICATWAEYADQFSRRRSQVVEPTDNAPARGLPQ